MCVGNSVSSISEVLYSFPSVHGAMQLKLHSVKTISGTSLQEQDAATKCSLHNGTTSMYILPLCYLHLVAASCSYRLVPEMVLTLCSLCWWCFSFHQLAQILHLHSWWLSPAATCAGGVFPWSTSAFTNVHAYCNLHCVVVVDVFLCCGGINI